ncbi:TIGR04255 family protein [Lutibacter sp.]|uniref:TIGR04255 family protein n=1 Tax=Lutibacter sp. TaxID=1925666 RepID=UPI0027367C7F|nr:TIGR04255 family protein [Lutibacter sp.]MDP3313580.1 TIGR04255 family protein [Lutibacter sp.]
MSKLPNAPLIEVIFEIKWDVDKSDILDFQYLHGDLYSKLKEEYPFRENVVPPEVPFEVVKGLPVFRYRKGGNDYPLIQVGPGLITFNTIDEKYFWNEYLIEVDKILKEFNNIYPKFHRIKLVPSISYVDFFEIDFSTNSPLNFINENLGLNVHQGYIDNDNSKTEEINLTFNNRLKSNLLSLNLINGRYNNKEGLVMQTKIIGNKDFYLLEDLNSWLVEAHDICSDVFKKITNGKLYNSFK